MRPVLLPVVSFLLGVGVAALWFQFAVKHKAESPAPPASSPSAGGRAAATSPANPSVAKPGTTSPAVIAEVRRALPNYKSLTAEQGAQMLRQAALKEFTATIGESNSKIAEIQAKLSKAVKSGSPAGQQAARTQLRQIQAAQTEKLQQIAARLQSELAALRQMKAATNDAAK